MNEKSPDRIEFTKKIGGLGEDRIIERTIYNPSDADIGDFFRRLHNAKIIEIGESQEFTPVCTGVGYVEDYVPIRNKEIKFIIIEKK